MTEPGTVLITGPTRNLGRHAVLAIARRAATRPAAGRPPGPALTAAADEARSAVPRSTRSAATSRAWPTSRRGHRARPARAGASPLRALVANAGIMSADTRRASADGYELTFAVNYLAHAQLIGDLLASFTTPARVVLLGSNTYHANFWRKLLRVPEAEWADPVELARPAGGEQPPGMEASGVAYSNAKLAILYYAHELQRQRRPGDQRVRVRAGLDARHRAGPRRPRRPGDEPRLGPAPRHLDAAALGAAAGRDGPRRPVGAPVFLDWCTSNPSADTGTVCNCRQDTTARSSPATAVRRRRRS